METQGQETLKLSDFTFLPEAEERIVQTPAFLRGTYGKLIFDKYTEAKRTQFKDNPNLQLEYINGEVVQSNLVDSALISQLVRPYGLRTANVRDLGNKRVLEMIKDKHYVDARALVWRSLEDSAEARNNPLARKLAKHIDTARALKEPALITGFDIVPEPKDKKGYGIKVIPSDKNFTIHYDDRLRGEYNEWKFDEVDEKGLPLHLSKDKGSRTWYTRNDGLSRVDVDGDWVLASRFDRLLASAWDGRVVLFKETGEASAPNFSAQYIVKMNEKANQQIAEINKRKEKALRVGLSIMQGKK